MPGEQSLYLFFSSSTNYFNNYVKNYVYQQLCQNESFVGTPPPKKKLQKKQKNKTCLPVISIPRIPVLE